MNLTDITRYKLTDIAIVERAQRGRVYPEGTVYIQVSATNGQVHQLKQSGTIENKYAIIIPKEYIYPPYFYIAVSRAVPNFLARYKTTINIQMKEFEMFDIDIHNDIDTQKDIGNLVEAFDDAIEQEGDFISMLKEVKKLASSKMTI